MINPRARDISEEWLKLNTVFRRYDDFIGAINLIMSLPEGQREIAFDAAAIQHHQTISQRQGLAVAGGTDQPVEGPLDRRVILRAVDAVHVVAQRHVHGGQGKDQ